MRKDTLIAGIVIFVIGLIMWQIGSDYLYKAQLFGMFGGNSAEIGFWGLFTFIGFILFIVGIIVSIGGAVLKEKNIIYQPNPQSQMPYHQQPVQQPVEKKMVNKNNKIIAIIIIILVIIVVCFLLTFVFQSGIFMLMSTPFF